jgi:hypothetical protein
VKALTRNTLLAIPLTLALYAVGAQDLLGAFTLAFCFTFVGHLVETVLLMIPGIETSLGRLIRMLGWFAGGLWCYQLGRWAWALYGNDLQVLPRLLYGGFFFVVLELIVHALLRAGGKPNFYSGGQT